MTLRPPPVLPAALQRKTSTIPTEVVESAVRRNYGAFWKGQASRFLSRLGLGKGKEKKPRSEPGAKSLAGLVLTLTYPTKAQKESCRGMGGRAEARRKRGRRKKKHEGKGTTERY